MSSTSPIGIPPHNLAACYQELFSTAAWLITGPGIGDPDLFSRDVVSFLGRADSAARSFGYSEEQLTRARVAITALLDDVILNSGKFLNWADNPLSIRLFHRGGFGELFFVYLDELLREREDRQTIELLECYLLCLLLGFRGQFRDGGREKLHAWREPIVERLHRVLGRGRSVNLQGTGQAAPAIDIPAPPQAMYKRALSISALAAAMIPLLFFAYMFFLGRGVSQLGRLISN